jgi:hypothetical protein
MEQESHASKVRRYSAAAAEYATDDDGGTKALTFALLALTEAVMASGTNTANLGTDIAELGKTVASLDAEVEKLRLAGGR